MKQRIPKFDDFLNERKFTGVDTNFIKKELGKVKDDICGNDLGNLEIEQIINRALRCHQIQFESGVGQSSFGDMAEFGLIDAAINDHRDIIIRYADYFYEKFEDDYEFNDFINVVQRIVAHELTHSNQLRQIRKGRDISDYYAILDKVQANLSNRFKYLSNKAEIQAFAVECVEEFRGLGYSDDAILKKMKTPFKDNVESNIFYLYMDYFNYTEDWLTDRKEKKVLKDVVDRFLKTMYQYITKDEII